MAPRPGRRYTHHMSNPERPLREQLIEARDKVRRELEIFQAPSSIGGSPDNRSVIADLQTELGQIQEALANLGSKYA